MKNPIFYLLAFFGIIALSLSGQNIELSFTGDNNGQPVILDSVKVKNLSQEGEIMLYPPDLTLELIITGSEDRIEETDDGFSLSQNYPNPFNSQTSVQLNVPKSSFVKMVVSNLLGQNLLTSSKVIGAGSHIFSFTPGKETCYFLTAVCEDQTSTIKMLCSPNETEQAASLKHSGQSFPYPVYKAMQLLGELPFELGDDLLFIGFNELGESGIIDSPEESSTYTIQFATNIPCIGAPTVDYEGQIYNTIQIYGQCWFKENLNVGTMINSSQAQLNNNVIEKYCLVDDPAQCDIYGGIYMWEELMHYSTEEGVQGICPTGWHVPSDEDWKVLEGAVDSQNGIGNSLWDLNNERGFDVAKNLKSTTGWYSGGNGVDAFGFTAISGGYYYNGVGWAGGTLFGPFYTSSHKVVGSVIKPCDRGLSWMSDEIHRGFDLKEHAKPIRCLKDLN